MMRARQFVLEVTELANRYNLNFSIVTDSASAIDNSGNPAVEHARKCHTEWEIANGIDPAHDWSDDPTK